MSSKIVDRFNCIKKAQLSWAFKSITAYRLIRYMVIANFYSLDHYLMSMRANAHIVMFSAYMCTCMARTNSDSNHHEYGNDY